MFELLQLGLRIETFAIKNLFKKSGLCSRNTLKEEAFAGTKGIN